MRRKKRLPAALLAFFLGWIGVHRFYLNQPVLGVVYILLSFLLISPILSIIDTIAFIAMSQEKFDKRYNKKWFEEGYTHRKRYPSRGQSRSHNKWKRHQHQKEEELRASYKLSSLKKDGISHFKNYEIEEALEDFRTALEIDSDDISLHFNIACCYSLLENVEKAKVHLDTAINLGFDDFERIQTHDALAFLRIQSDWPEFIARQEEERAELPSGKKGQNLFDRLKQLAELRQQGILTEEEYKEKKEGLLRG
jgi:TM2 domain-containing membrane protein YozV